MSTARIVKGVGLAAILGAGTLLGAGSASAATYNGCPSGAVCIYPTNNANGDPDVEFYSYGYHNLSNQYGDHEVLDNQTGSHVGSYSCSGYGGTGTILYALGYPTQTQPISRDEYLTPVNSIVLSNSASTLSAIANGTKTTC